jgi:hypothetical protein
VPGDKGAMAAAPQGEDVYATVSAPNRGTTVQSTDPSKLLLNDLYLPGTFLPLNHLGSCLLELPHRCIGVGTLAERCRHHQEVGSLDSRRFGRCDGSITSKLDPDHLP